MEDGIFQSFDNYDYLIEATKNRSKLFIIGMLFPRRLGAMLFSSLLEHRYYKPGTADNEKFILHLINWQEMHWWVIEIPREDIDKATKTAEEVGLKFADGIPTMIASERGKIGWQPFPVTDGRNIVSIEYLPNHVAYKNDPKLTRIFEDLEITYVESVIMHGYIGPVDFKVIVEGKDETT